MLWRASPGSCVSLAACIGEHVEGQLPCEYRGLRRCSSGRSVINIIRRAVSAAGAGIALSLAGVVMATPAHADGPAQSILCGAAAYVSDQLLPPLCPE